MGLSVAFLFVTDWSHLSHPRSSDETNAMIGDAANYSSNAEWGLPSLAGNPHWCHEWEAAPLFFSNWKAAFWAGEYYEKEVRPYIQDDEDRTRADRVFEATMWAGDDCEAKTHHDLAEATRFDSTGSGNLLFSFSPENVEQYLNSLSKLVGKLEKMDLPPRSSDPGSNKWFASLGQWISYLRNWMDLFSNASKIKAGLIGWAC